MFVDFVTDDQKIMILNNLHIESLPKINPLSGADTLHKLMLIIALPGCFSKGNWLETPALFIRISILKKRMRRYGRCGTGNWRA